MGSVLLPGEQGPGLDASFEMNGESIRLTAGAGELGTWSHREFDVAPSGKGTFRLDLGDDTVLFTPSSPSKFAEALHVPLQPEAPVEERPAPKRGRGGRVHTDQQVDVDAAIDELIAEVTPTGKPKSDDVLSKPLLGLILIVSGAIMVGLIGMTLTL